MKALIAWLTRRQRCACGNFKPPRAPMCFDCETRIADAIRETYAEQAEKWF